MPGPPPPPPPAGGPPPPPAFSMPPPSSGPNERSALLKSIQKGTKLKKTVTVDKSAPVIPGKVSSAANSNSNSSSQGNDRPQMSGLPMVNGLGGLFSDGMPKLKPVKNIGNTSTSNSTSTTSTINNNNNHFANTQKQIKMQIKASDNKNRGPPPPAPTRNISNMMRDPPPKKYPPPVKNGTSHGMQFNTSVPNLAGMNMEPNRSSLYKKTMSNTNLGALDTTDSGRNNNNMASKPTNFGKPQLAPKPPPLNGKPSLKRISLNRTQSMHSPRSPSPQGPGIHDKMKFGTVRNLKPAFIDSLENMHQASAPRPPVTERPKAPPPSIPNTPPPPSKTVIKHPGHAPPPPPPISAPMETPAQAPPPLPHRTPPQVPRVAPIANGSSAPVPPPRFSSMKDVGDFEARFADKFRDISEFPSPIPFRGLEKVYLGIQVFSSNKQQAPLPPNHLPMNMRMWDSSTC